MIGVQQPQDVQIPDGFLSIFSPEAAVLPLEDLPCDPDELALVSVGEAARIVGVHANTIRNWADRGLLRATRLPGNHRRLALRDVRRLAESIVATLAPPDIGSHQALPDGVVERLRAQTPFED